MNEKYQQYLCSREWSEKKEIVKERSKGICERCSIQSSNHVHHLTYARQYHEDLNDLQDICEDCHRFIHAKSDFDPLCLPPGGATIILTQSLADCMSIREFHPWVYKFDKKLNIETFRQLTYLHDDTGNYVGRFKEAEPQFLLCYQTRKDIIRVAKRFLDQGREIYYIRPPKTCISWNNFSKNYGQNVVVEYIKKYYKLYTVYTELSFNITEFNIDKE